MIADAFDTVIRGGTVVTASESFRGDVGIREGRIAVIAERISGGAERIDAGGLLVLPGASRPTATSPRRAPSAS